MLIRLGLRPIHLLPQGEKDAPPPLCHPHAAALAPSSSHGEAGAKRRRRPWDPCRNAAAARDGGRRVGAPCVDMGPRAEGPVRRTVLSNQDRFGNHGKVRLRPFCRYSGARTPLAKADTELMKQNTMILFHTAGIILTSTRKPFPAYIDTRSNLGPAVGDMFTWMLKQYQLSQLLFQPLALQPLLSSCFGKQF